MPPRVLVLRCPTKSNACIDPYEAIVQSLGGLDVIASVRQFYCSVCRVVVCVCSSCDRGQGSCTEHAFTRRRPMLVQAARVRYARSSQGRQRAALRKLRQRVRDQARQRDEEIPAWARLRVASPEALFGGPTTVTDTGSPPVASSVIVPPRTTTTVSSDAARPEQRGVANDADSSGTRSCSFCGRRASLVRFGFRRRRGPSRPRRPG